MNILAIGLNHKNTPLDIREKLFFPEDKLKEPLKKIVEIDGIDSGILLSTCNRTEIYAHSKGEDSTISSLKSFFSESKNYQLSEFEDYLYIVKSKNALNHIFRVASSLDSLVIGEPQILGQFKKSFQIASEVQTVDFILIQIMTKALETAKKVRTETDIAKNPVSVSSSAVDLAKKIFGNLDDKSVLIIGAGEMAELAVEHFITDGISNVSFVNRSFEKAEKMAKAYGGKAVPIENYLNSLQEIDIIITSTGAPHYLINAKDIKKIMRVRKYKPIFFIDISVPRNIDPGVNDFDNAYVYDIDDLKQIVETNIARRQNEVEKAIQIINKEVSIFISWYNSLSVVPTIKSLREKFDNIRQSEIQRILSKSGNSFGDKEKDLIEAFSISYMNKILHEPLVKLKEFTDSDRGLEHVEVAKKLFNIENQ